METSSLQNHLPVSVHKRCPSCCNPNLDQTSWAVCRISPVFRLDLPEGLWPGEGGRLATREESAQASAVEAREGNTSQRKRSGTQSLEFTFAITKSRAKELATWLVLHGFFLWIKWKVGLFFTVRGWKFGWRRAFQKTCRWNLMRSDFEDNHSLRLTASFTSSRRQRVRLHCTAWRPKKTKLSDASTAQSEK